ALQADAGAAGHRAAGPARRAAASSGRALFPPPQPAAAAGSRPPRPAAERAGHLPAQPGAGSGVDRALLPPRRAGSRPDAARARHAAGGRAQAQAAGADAAAGAGHGALSMRKLILALLILLLSVAAALVLYRWGGLVIITLGEWTLQTSVLFFVLALVAALVLLQLAVALLRGLFGVPGRLGQWRQQRRERQVRNRLIKGLLRLAEGRSEEAEKLLTWKVHLSEAPLLHYLGAAIAAQRQGAHEQRDAYLAQADKSSPKASLAVGLIQAQLQLEARQWEQALATLHYLHDLAPNHPRVQAMLLRACEALGEWKRIELLLPAARRQKAVSSGELSRLEWTAALRRLQQAQAQGAAAVEAAWNSLDRRLRQDTDLEIVYVDGLAANGQGEQAERLLRTRLNKSYDPRLAQRYGQLPLAAPEKALSQVEKRSEERRVGKERR